jgi:hypothetical protein
MPNCPTANHNTRQSTSHTTPWPLALTIWLLESALAQVICFFDALERLIPPYVILVTGGSIAWSITQYGFFSGIMFGIPLGLVMAFVHAIAIVLAMFILGILLWLALVPIYLIASSCRWQLPTVLEQNPTVEHWLQHWSHSFKRRETAPQSATQQAAGMIIGVLLGCWLLD